MTIEEVMADECDLEDIGDGTLAEIHKGWIGNCLRCGQRRMHVSHGRQTFHCFACGLGGHEEAAQELVDAHQTGNIAEYSESHGRLADDTWHKMAEALQRYNTFWSAPYSFHQVEVITNVMAGLIQGAMDKAVNDAEK